MKCNNCVLSKRCRGPVPGVGRKSADIMFVGQAPGIQEDKEKLPFIGDAGLFLSNSLEFLGIRSIDCYWTNVVKCFTGRERGGDVKPPPFAIKACTPILLREIAEIRPKLIVAVGEVAMRYFGIKGGVKINNGRVFDTPYGAVLVILHPAGLMRRPEDTPKFVTGLHTIHTHLRGVSTPPPWVG